METHQIHRHLLPPTGQTTSFFNEDDGWFEAGKKFTNRFIDIGDNQAFDRATELIWVKSSPLIFPGQTGELGDDFGGGASTARGNWADSTAYLKGDLVENTVGGGGDDLFYVAVNDHTGDGAANNRPDVDATNWIETIWTDDASAFGTWVGQLWSNDGAVDGAMENIATLNTSTYNGRSDWRLPNILELFTTVDWETFGGFSSPLVDPAPAAWFWSSTSRSAANAFAVTSAVPANLNSFGKTTSDIPMVRPCRGGRTNPPFG